MVMYNTRYENEIQLTSSKAAHAILTDGELPVSGDAGVSWVVHPQMLCAMTKFRSVIALP